ncbi:MAG: pyrroline-5-carboxylate reductase [Lentisphaerae bacterium]|jgi:pyrroline-5-carboxylate reductase|nr:pyrroline-5-carboxylate reductase [Lentisphaerota bacterium]
MKATKGCTAADSLRVGFLGVGKMGGAILASLISGKAIKAKNAYICDASSARVKELSTKYRVRASDVAEVTRECDVVFLGVKPQDLALVIDSIPDENYSKPLFISIAAGRKMEWLEARMPKARIIRVMPNLAVSVGLGMSGYCGGARVRKMDLNLAAKLLNCTGKAALVSEDQLDAVTALSGSGPAFISYALMAMINGGIELGLEENIATEFAIQTMLGTATVLSEEYENVEDFIKAVTSSKGTTEAGLSVLDKSAFSNTMKRALVAAARRSKELSKLS